MKDLEWLVADAHVKCRISRLTFEAVNNSNRLDLSRLLH